MYALVTYRPTNVQFHNTNNSGGIYARRLITYVEILKLLFELVQDGRDSLRFHTLQSG